jgi:hypothetical protein
VKLDKTVHCFDRLLIAPHRNRVVTPTNQSWKQSRVLRFHQ